MLGLGLGLSKGSQGLNRPLLNQIPNAVAGLGLNRLNSDVVEYENIVTNGDFSDGTTGYSISSGGGVSVELDNIVSLYNGASIKFINISTNFNVATKALETQIGKFFYSVWAKGENLSGIIYNRIRLVGTNLASLSIDTGTYDWKRFSIVFDVAEFDRILLGSTSGFEGTLWQDGVQLIKMSGTRYENYTAEQMNEAFPFTPTTAKAIVPQKPIRVYRDSDNAETDIGLIGNTLDTTSLLSFAGAGSAYVVKIYDQTNNGNNAIQSVAANCPRIVNAGVLEVDSNGDVSIYYDGTNDRFDITDNIGLDITSGGLSLVAKYDRDNSSHYIISKNDSSLATLQYAMASINNIGMLYLENTQNIVTDESTDNKKILALTYDFARAKSYLFGSLIQDNATTLPLTSRANIQIGCRSNSLDGSTKAAFFTGHISSIIIFNRAITQPEVTKLNKL